eukprot:364851_1
MAAIGGKHAGHAHRDIRLIPIEEPGLSDVFISTIPGMAWGFAALYIISSSVFPDPSAAKANIIPIQVYEVNAAIGCFLVIYFVVSFYCRYISNGPHVLYDMLWPCNLGLLLAAYGTIFSNPIFIGAPLLMTMADQLFWNIDIIAKVFTGNYIFGVAKYMSWPATTLIVKVTALHHVWFCPLCLYLLRGIGIPETSWWAVILLGFVLSLRGRFHMPYLVKSSKKIDEVIYINSNLGHKFWDDIDIKLFHLFDDYPWYIYLPFMQILLAVMNYPFFYFSRYLFDDYLQNCTNVRA